MPCTSPQLRCRLANAYNAATNWRVPQKTTPHSALLTPNSHHASLRHRDLHIQRPIVVAIELHIVVEHGVNISAVCQAIIGQVRYLVTENTGAVVRGVNVCVDSMTM